MRFAPALRRPDDIGYTRSLVPRNWPIRAFTEVFAVAIEMPWTDGKPYIAGPRPGTACRALDRMPDHPPAILSMSALVCCRQLTNGCKRALTSFLP